MGMQKTLLNFTQKPPDSVWVSTRENILWEFAHNKGADQSAHLHILISAFVIRFVESIIFNLATSEISSFELVFVAERTGLSLALSETLKTDFVARRPV